MTISKPYPDYPDEVTWSLPMYTTATREKPVDAHYDKASADRVMKFIHAIRHFKGEFANQPFDLLPWQEHEVFRPLFGWKMGFECTTERRSDGSCGCPRLYLTLYLETPKKNGKTQIGAGIAGYMAFGDGEAAAEVFTYAADKDQAKLAFDALSFGMGYDDNPFTAKGIEALAAQIRNKRTGSFVKVQSAKTQTKHGPNAHCIIFDELHAQPNRDLWDITTTGVIARRQPLTAALTTAGWDRNSICWEQHEHARQVSERIYDDPRYLGVVYSVPEDADWTEPATWYAASPSLGVTVQEAAYEQKALEAKQMPLFQNSFRQLFLSQWTQQAVRYLPLEDWDKCATSAKVERRQLAYGGLDLASTTDLAAFALIFPNDDETWDVLLRYYIPEENIRQRGLRDRVPYDQWVKDGLIKATPGNTIKYEFIKADILEAKAEYDLREIGYDPWNAVGFVQDLERERIKLSPMIQGYKSFTAPTKELLRLVLEKRVRHGGNPVLRWNVDSAAAEEDAAGNVKLNKAKSSARIDGLIALIMALDSALRHPTKKRKSIYMREDLDPGATSEESEIETDEEEEVAE